MDPVISVEALTKSYGDCLAVSDVSFEVYEGEIFGILGPNGAGKTTTVECVQGLREPGGGTIRVLGLDPGTHGDRLRRLIGSQLQESALPQRMKVWEALDLFSALLPGGPPWQTTLEEWNLVDKAGAAFGHLSGGQRQRLLVALAVVNRPRIVFLDEMTTGLDPAARRATWSLIERIRDGGTTVVLVTHFMDEAERLCDRLAVIGGGRIVASGTPGRLVTDFARSVTVRFSTDAADVSHLSAVDGVEAVRRRGAVVEVDCVGTAVPHVGKDLVDHGLDPVDFFVDRPTLEDVYLRLVGDEGA